MFRPFTVAWLCLPLLAGSLAHAAPAPRTIGFMGVLNAASGQPVNSSVQVTLSLFDAATGGTALWSETQTVQVTNGLFSTALGSLTPFPSGLDFSRAYFVGVTPHGEAEMKPRIPLQGVPYALFAHGVAENSVGPPQLAANAGSLSRVSGGAMTSNGGNIGVGTDSPSSILSLVRRSDANATISVDSGQLKARYSAIDLQDRGTAQWGLGKDPSNHFYIDESGVGRVFTILPGGNVGLGTENPAARLDVRGSIRMGGNGGLYAPGADENLRIIRGSLREDGTPAAGTGYTSRRLSPGVYAIEFAPNTFSGAPTVVVSPETVRRYPAGGAESDSQGGYYVSVVVTDDNVNLVNGSFDFIIAGPR